MTAIVLLHTNPGFQEKGRSVLKSIATKNVKVNRCFMCLAGLTW